jgi:hypothetical protein
MCRSKTAWKRSQAPRSPKTRRTRSASRLLAVSRLDASRSTFNPAAELRPKSGKKVLSETETKNQIQAIIKHICASNAFLPILEEKCTFNVLAYTSTDATVPEVWAESDARMIKSGSVEQVRRSLSGLIPTDDRPGQAAQFQHKRPQGRRMRGLPYRRGLRALWPLSLKCSGRCRFACPLHFFALPFEPESIASTLEKASVGSYIAGSGRRPGR